MRIIRNFRASRRRYLICFPLLAALLPFCSKSPTDSDSGDPGNTDLESVTRAVTALGSADSVYTALLETAGREAAVAATVQYLQSLAMVSEAGMAPDSSVYVFYENGLLGCVYNPDLGTRSEEATPAAKSFPEYGGGEATAIATALLPFASEFGEASETEVINRINTCFGSEEPVTEVYRNEQVTVSRVAGVLASSPGVLFWSGHGVMVPTAPGSGLFTMGLVTGEIYDSEAAANAVVNIYKERALGDSREIVVLGHGGRHYLLVLPSFVSRHADLDKLEGMGHNATKSIVYICCCSSGDIDMAYSFINAGAEAYYGWDSPVSVAFASQTHKRFFKELTDTCTAGEAYDLCSTGTDPENGAWLESFYGDSDVMIRAHVKMTRDGEDLRGYSVGVVADDEISVAGWTDLHDISRACSFDIVFPATGPGTFDCLSNEDAVIAVVKMATGKVYFAQKGLNGVTGTITVKRAGEDLVSGEFFGTLGYWTLGKNPSKDPPDETMTIENGFFKHTGLRY